MKCLLYINNCALNFCGSPAPQKCLKNKSFPNYKVVAEVLFHIFDFANHQLLLVEWGGSHDMWACVHVCVCACVCVCLCTCEYCKLLCICNVWHICAQLLFFCAQLLFFLVYSFVVLYTDACFIIIGAIVCTVTTWYWKFALCRDDYSTSWYLWR